MGRQGRWDRLDSDPVEPTMITVLDEREGYLLVTNGSQFAVVERRAGRYYSLHDGLRHGVSLDDTGVRELIQDLQPVVGLHGHVHESPGASKLGHTVCINPGSDYQDGLLRGAIVELDTEQGLRSWQLVQG